MPWPLTAVAPATASSSLPVLRRPEAAVCTSEEGLVFSMVGLGDALLAGLGL